MDTGRLGECLPHMALRMGDVTARRPCFQGQELPSGSLTEAVNKTWRLLIALRPFLQLLKAESSLLHPYPSVIARIGHTQNAISRRKYSRCCAKLGSTGVPTVILGIRCPSIARLCILSGRWFKSVLYLNYFMSSVAFSFTGGQLR